LQEHGHHDRKKENQTKQKKLKKPARAFQKDKITSRNIGHDGTLSLISKQNAN